jgi:mannan endo-1,4-beta-mannosidase
MRFATTALGLTLVTSSIAAPTLLNAESSQPACAYPIGQSGGSNAKVAGRLFNIDGKVEYFAGWNEFPLQTQQLICYRKQCMVARTS